jgi:hypothetical protein
MVFACDGQEFAEAESDLNGTPNAQIRRDGTPDPEDVAQAVTYWRVRAAAEKALGIEADDE